jgi:Uma2 family endonuclease
MSPTLLEPGREAKYRGLRMTADHYLALPPDGFLYELVDGVVCMSPSPVPRHQKVSTEVAVQIGLFLRQRPLGQVMVEVDVRLGDDLVYRPDVVYLSMAKAVQCQERITLPPDVIVEVLSPDSRVYDQETKRQDYERCGVGEYWMVDPTHGTFQFLRLEGGRYVEAAASSDTYDSRVIEGFRLDLGRIRSLFK